MKCNNHIWSGWKTIDISIKDGKMIITLMRYCLVCDQKETDTKEES